MNDTGIPHDLLFIMIASAIVFCGSLVTLWYGIRMDSDKSKKNLRAHAVGKHSVHTIGQRFSLDGK